MPGGFAAALGVAILWASVVISPALAAEPETVAIYTYHTHPPFLTGERQGLTYELADHLTKLAKGQYSFHVQPLSRPRLDQLIREPRTAIVPWVNPAWFGDREESKYLWSSGALMTDANSIISRADTRLVYDGPRVLEGLVFGGIRGHVYTGIDDFIRESKSTRRVDAANHFANFQKLLNQRIDATLTPKSAALFLIRKERLEDRLFISPTPHSTYERRILIVNRQEKIKAFIDRAVEWLRADRRWSALVEQYR